MIKTLNQENPGMWVLSHVGRLYEDILSVVSAHWRLCNQVRYTGKLKDRLSHSSRPVRIQ